MGEFPAFRVTLTAKGRDTYAARSGEHDDLVIAIALALPKSLPTLKAQRHWLTLGSLATLRPCQILCQWY